MSRFVRRQPDALLPIRRTWGRLIRHVALAGVCAMTLTSCARLFPWMYHRKIIMPATAPSPEYLGTVYVIGTGRQFVLVQTPADQRAASLHDGEGLICRTNGQASAALRVSHERRPPFIVADVVSGEPHVGDDVYVELSGQKPVEPPPALPMASASPPPTPASAQMPQFR